MIEVHHFSFRLKLHLQSVTTSNTHAWIRLESFIHSGEILKLEVSLDNIVEVFFCHAAQVTQIMVMNLYN